MAIKWDDGTVTDEAPPPTRIRWDDGTTEDVPSSALGAFGRGLLESALPTAAGLGAAGAVLAAVPTGGASLLAIPAGLAAGFGASKLQDVGIRAINPQGRKAFLRQRAQDIREHPVASTVGEFAPALATLRPGLPRTLPLARTAAVSGAVQGGIEAGAGLATEGRINPARVATSTALGATLIRPTRLGTRLGFRGPKAEAIPDPSTPPITERVQRITEALEAAKPIRGQQETLFTQERGRRLARMMGVRERVQGEAGFHAELAQLKGELPKAQFESVRPKVDQADVDGLFNDINASSLDVWDQLNAKTGLSKLLQPTGGQVPTQNELRLLREVFGPKLIQAALRKRPLLQRLGQGGIELANLPRALMASFDLSAPLRQGVFLIGRPKQWLPAFGSMFRQFASEQAFQAAQAQIKGRPTYDLMRQARLALTEIGEFASNREEQFMSRWGERIPLIGVGVKASNRAYVGFLNKLRADVFDDLYKKGQALGVADDPNFLSSVSSFVNAATGRGGVGSLERSAVVLNSVFFSPRLMASRLSLLNPGFYVQQHPTVRKEAVKSLLTFASTGMTVLGLAKLNGASIGVDPRNPDFGKIRVGNTRFDIWGGFQQYIRGAAQLITGRKISSTTGREIVLGEGYRATSRLDIVSQFLKSKQAPIVSLLTTLLEGKTITGQAPRFPVEVVDRFIPMFVQDAFEVIREHGPAKGWMGIPGAFGVGAQTYGTLIPMLEKTPAGRPTVKFRDQPSLGETLVNRATGRQVSNIPAEQHPALRQARTAELQRKLDVDKAKRLTLEDGKRRRVGNTLVWIQNGIVKTKTLGRVQTPMRAFQQQQRQLREIPGGTRIRWDDGTIE